MNEQIVVIPQLGFVIGCSDTSKTHLQYTPKQDTTPRRTTQEKTYPIVVKSLIIYHPFIRFKCLLMIKYQCKVLPASFHQHHS